jgi:anti-sigma B factor antagonist
MPLDIRQRENEGIMILDLKGRLTAGESVPKLRETIRSLLDSGRKNILLNMKGVDYIDSTGLGSMVICYTSAKKEGGAVKLLDLSRRNIELLVLTKLTTVFEIFNEERDAINSFFPAREIKRFDILSFLQEQEESGD